MGFIYIFNLFFKIEDNSKIKLYLRLMSDRVLLLMCVKGSWESERFARILLFAGHWFGGGGGRSSG